MIAVVPITNILAISTKTKTQIDLKNAKKTSSFHLN